MISFKQYILEKYNFGSTAYGNADIDKTTAAEIQKGILKPSWQYLGNKNNKLTVGYSVANNALPHGTLVKITDKNGNPVGSQFGNTEGIYKVEDIGGPNVTKNIDFYSGSNKEMYNYFANLGQINVTPVNLPPEQEKTLTAKLQKYQGTGTSQDVDAVASAEKPEESPYASMFAQFLPSLQGGFSKEQGLANLKGVMDRAVGAIQSATGKKIPTGKA
jgi:3D (Asp-Asp-Asp) domain-containing protein